MARFLLIGLVLFGGLFINANEAEAQLFNTRLRITVLDELGNVVPDAEVTLYANEADYNKEVNEVKPKAKTDEKGRVTFKDLDPQAYYVIVRKGKLTNVGGGEIIGQLEKRKLNKANVVVSDDFWR